MKLSRLRVPEHSAHIAMQSCMIQKLTWSSTTRIRSFESYCYRSANRSERPLRSIIASFYSTPTPNPSRRNFVDFLHHSFCTVKVAARKSDGSHARTRSVDCPVISGFAAISLDFSGLACGASSPRSCRLPSLRRHAVGHCTLATKSLTAMGCAEGSFEVQHKPCSVFPVQTFGENTANLLIGRYLRSTPWGFLRVHNHPIAVGAASGRRRFR